MTFLRAFILATLLVLPSAFVWAVGLHWSVHCRLPVNAHQNAYQGKSALFVSIEEEQQQRGSRMRLGAEIKLSCG